MAHAHAKKALLKFLVVLSLHSHIACDRFSRGGQKLRNSSFVLVLYRSAIASELSPETVQIS